MSTESRAGWEPVDCHAHTTMSDGELIPEDLVRVVRARGVRPSISDHISTDGRGWVSDLDDVREYLDVLDELDVARGGEFCYHDPLWREIPDDLVARFTYRIGSLHAIAIPGLERPLNVFRRTLPEGLTPQKYMEHHLAMLERFAREMPVDILAHPTLVPIPFREMPAEELWTEQHEERLVRALARAGIAFEVSNRYKAHRRIVQRAHDAGVRLSLGSDGHAEEQVGDLTYPLAMVRAIGAKREELYDPYVHGTRGALKA